MAGITEVPWLTLGDSATYGNSKLRVEASAGQNRTGDQVTARTDIARPLKQYSERFAEPVACVLRILSCKSQSSQHK